MKNAETTQGGSMKRHSQSRIAAQHADATPADKFYLHILAPSCLKHLRAAEAFESSHAFSRCREGFLLGNFLLFHMIDCFANIVLGNYLLFPSCQFLYA